MFSRFSRLTRRTCLALTALALSGGMSLTSSNALAQASDASTAAAAAPRVALETSAGRIVLQLDPAAAPLTVANFLEYVQAGHYNGTVFHRVIGNFMIQGGGFTPDMQQKPTRAPVRNEADNGLKNEPYTIAMARTNDPHSATAQFFINVANNEFLNYRAPNPQGWGYAVFGRVIEGQDVVDRIKAVPTGRVGMFQDVPREPVVITQAEVLQ